MILRPALQKVFDNAAMEKLMAEDRGLERLSNSLSKASYRTVFKSRGFKKLCDNASFKETLMDGTSRGWIERVMDQ